MGKRAKTKTRRTKLPALDTAAGRASVEQTRRFLNERFSQPDERVALPEHMIWSLALPGFMGARATALQAVRTCQAELKFWRLLASAKDDQQRVEIIALEDLRMGLRPAAEVLAELSANTIPENRAQTARNVLRKAPQAMRDAALLGCPKVFLDLAEQLRMEGNPSANLDAAKRATVVLGRTASLPRAFFAASWISAGLWLAEMPDAAAWFLTEQQRLPEMSSLAMPSESTLRVWKSELGLEGYNGKGRLHFDQHGLPRANESLNREIVQACLEQPLGRFFLENFVEFIAFGTAT